VGHPLSWLGRLGIVWLSLVAALASYFFIENPARHTARRTWQGLSLGLTVSGVVAAAAVFVIANPPSLVGSGAAVKVVQAKVGTPAVVKRMRAAVATGVDTVDAPSNLTPSAAKAAHDLPAADGTNCHAAFTVIQQGACVYGDPKGTHTAVILGDSHADMWLPAFASAGVTKHWKIVDWTKSSCPAAEITVFNSSLNRTYTECNTWRADVLRRIAVLKPSRVFFSGSENVAPAGVTPQQWSSATTKTLQTLRRTTTATVTLIQDVPIPSYNLPSCVAQHLNSVTRCTFQLAKAYSFPARHRGLATAVAHAGFAVVDPDAWICTATTCPAIVGNMLVYRDDTHLTATFARWLAPMVAPLLSAPAKGH
jgi:SGNH domain (fused to AT3 domains)